MTTTNATLELENHPVVSEADWLTARLELLKKEKEFTRLKDELSRQRRALPWTRVEKNYVFDGPDGKQTLAELFEGRSQLVVYHFMFGPGWDAGCVGCSFVSDHIDGARQHFEQHDVKLVVISRAPFEELDPFRWRMGWKFKWVSSFGSTFNYDYHVSFTKEELAAGPVFENYGSGEQTMEETSAVSVFYKDETGAIYHTYSAFERGVEELVTTYSYLDLTPKGRNENGPHFNLGDWVRHHDRYGAGGHVTDEGRYVAPKNGGPCCSEAQA